MDGRKEEEKEEETLNMTGIGFSTIISFVGFFVLFMVLGFYGKYWRRGNLNDTHEWSLAGRKLGTTFVFFLIGADIYTSVAFVANSSGVFAKGSLYFFAIPFAVLTFGVALVTMQALAFIKGKRIRYCF
jgi:solute:Na+ symporter, SSS family